MCTICICICACVCVCVCVCISVVLRWSEIEKLTFMCVGVGVLGVFVFNGGKAGHNREGSDGSYRQWWQPQSEYFGIPGWQITCLWTHLPHSNNPLNFCKVHVSPDGDHTIPTW